MKVTKEKSKGKETKEKHKKYQKVTKENQSEGN